MPDGSLGQRLAGRGVEALGTGRALRGLPDHGLRRSGQGQGSRHPVPPQHGAGLTAGTGQPVPRRLDGEPWAQVTALRLGPPPTDRGSWSRALLAPQMFQLGMVAPISLEAVKQPLDGTGIISMD